MGARTAEQKVSGRLIVSDNQIDQLGQLVDELDNLSGATRLAMPPAFHLKQLQRALPELSAKLKALVVEISGDNPWSDE